MKKYIHKKNRKVKQTAAFHQGREGINLQQPFDVAVVIPTTLRPTLSRALNSVFSQDFNGKVQILLGVDKSAVSRDQLKEMFAGQPDNYLITCIDLGYSTSLRHGGLHLAGDGGALRTVLSYLANSHYVAYLDDDNWWGSNHLSTLMESIKGVDWSFSLRWYVDCENEEPLCIDKWESTGVGSGYYKKRFGGFVDPNCLLINKKSCEPVLRLWSLPFDKKAGAMNADRNVFNALKSNYRYGSSGKATCFYVIDLQNDHPRRISWIKSNMLTVK